MNAAQHAHDFLAIENIPSHIITEVESLLDGYELPYSPAQWKAFNDLLQNFVFLYENEGQAAVSIFDSYLIKE